MQRRHRLTSNADFQRARQRGRRFSGPLLTLHARSNAGQDLRVGVTVGKRFGSAVERNRIKRRIREIVRLRISTLAAGWDLVFLPRPDAVKASFDEIALAVEQLLLRAEIVVAASQAEIEAEP